MNLDGECLPQVTEKLHLGITVPSNLRRSKHIDNIIESTSGRLTVLKRLAYRHQLPSMVLRKFYLCFIRPKLECSSAVWCGCSRSDSVKLDRLQTQASRAITREQDAARALVLADLPTLSHGIGRCIALLCCGC